MNGVIATLTKEDILNEYTLENAFIEYGEMNSNEILESLKNDRV